MTLAQFQQAVEQLIMYNWEKEFRDFAEQGSPEDHIFRTIVQIDDFLTGSVTDPEWYVMEANEQAEDRAEWVRDLARRVELGQSGAPSNSDHGTK